MFKIIKGSNDIQEIKERTSNKNKRSQERKERSNRDEGSGLKKKPKKDSVNYNQRPTNKERARVESRTSGGTNRRWKVILIDIATHEEYEFIFSKAIGIGRAYVKDGFEDYLVINDPKVSKIHCSIFTDGEGLYIKDEGSSNYTFVNNSRIQRPTLIQKEDLIGLGNTELEVLKVFRESR
jgi:hypothetical protein